MNWRKDLNAVILQDEPLDRHTTLKVGPKADFWIEPRDREALKELIKRARQHKKDYLVIGFGSKLLIAKKRLGLAIHLGSDAFTQVRIEGEDLIAGSGASAAKLIRAALNSGLGGLEFLNGIPATVGGAVRLNAGVGYPERIEIGAFVRSLEVMDKSGRIKVLDKKALEFGYRYSSLDPYIILSARFSLFKKRKQNIRVKMEKYWNYRLKTQELGYPSAGCVFKNPEGDSSGRLIDACGLKGRRIGNALISRRHANFIVNLGQALPADVLSLMKLAQRQVNKKFKIKLEPEIQVI